MKVCHTFASLKVMKMMRIKLFFRLLSGFIVLFASYNIQAQTSEVQINVMVDGSKCSSNGKAKVTVLVAASKEGDVIDYSNAVYTFYNDQKMLSNKSPDNTIELAPGNKYNVYVDNVLCNGKPVSGLSSYTDFVVTLGLNITKAEYKRCSVSDVFVSVDVLGGTGPYTYKLLDGNNLIDTKSSSDNTITFPAKNSSSNLKIEVSDKGCPDNSPVIKDLTTSFVLDSSLIEGDKTVCKNGDIKLSVKSAYSGSNFKWKKGDKVISTSQTMQLSNVSETEAGTYSFSMILDGCNNSEYSESFTLEIGGPNVPNVSTAYICFNSGEISLSEYASVTSDIYTLVWYNADGSLIGETAPKFNPNLTTTKEYLVSQKNSTGCESAKARLTVVVEELPAPIGGNNILFCTSNDSKPVMRIINAGNHTYNLYTEYSGGTKIGSGTAVNDTVVIKTDQDLVIGNTYFLETQNIHGCVSSEKTTVVISTKDSWILGPEKICFGDNLSLSSDYAGGHIEWTKPDGSTVNNKILSIDNVKFTDAGVYKLFIKESGLGCIMRDELQVTVTQPAPPTVTVSSFRYFQNESPSAMTAIPKDGFKLKWYNHDGKLLQEQSPKPATDKMGLFVYHVSQDSLGCESSKVEITVTVGEIPASVPIADVNICIADKPVIQISNTIQDYKYTVYYKNEVIAEGKGNGGEISLTSKVAISENTELAVSVSDIYDISSERAKISLISANNLIDLQNSTPSVCDGSTGKLVAVDITGASYEWTTLTGTVTGQLLTIPNASDANTGVYTLTVSLPGCHATAKQSVEFKIEKPAKPSVAAKELYYCTGNEADMLTATALPGYKLVWFDESLTKLADTPAINTSTAGTWKYYVLQVSVSDENCSSELEEITVVVEDKPETVVLDPVNVCIMPGNTKSVSVRIPDSSEGYIYSLYSQETGGSVVGYAASTGEGLPVDITINDSEVVSGTIYYLEIKNKADCISDRTPVEIVISEITVSPDELPPYQINEFYSQRLTTTVPEPRYEVVEGYLPIGFTLSSMGDISGTATEYADPFVFTVEVTSSLGCAVKKEYTIKSELLVSKMFSPNGDGINDTFMKGYKVVIFDCLGRKLFSGDNGWDGTYNGKVMPEDVYYYILYYKDKDGKERRVTSYITLIKTI
jgi:gliding motility-associated-like protein